MKALTDKIIEALEARAYGQFNISTRKEIERAIEEIKEIEKNAEFEEIARVMMKHLAQGEKYNPHYSTIITNSSAELVEGRKAINNYYGLYPCIMDYIPD